VTILAFACATVDEEREQIALRYAESVTGIFVDDGAGQRRSQPRAGAASAAASTRWTGEMRRRATTRSR
jgi:hypothetical protein